MACCSPNRLRTSSSFSFTNSQFTFPQNHPLLPKIKTSPPITQKAEIDLQVPTFVSPISPLPQNSSLSQPYMGVTRTQMPPSELSPETPNLFPETDIAAAAQGLVQLSDEEKASSSHSHDHHINNNVKSIEKNCVQEEISSKKTMDQRCELDGEDHVILRRKKRKYRSLKSIYEATRPLKVRYGKNGEIYVEKTLKGSWDI